MSSPFVTSNFTREPNDHYPTVDPRCMIALRASWDLPLPAIHSYQWLVWDRRHSGEPIIRYHNGKEK